MSRITRYGPSDEPLGECVVALGVFDGVHLGHQSLLADAVALASSEGTSSVAITFDRHPEDLLRPEEAPHRLLEREERLELIAAQGIDRVVELVFDDMLSRTTAETFVDTLVSRICKPSIVVVGRDFRFGARAAGDVEMLKAFSAERGFRVVPHELVVVEGAPVTSTRIRGLLAEGRVEEAAQLLGRPHHLRGRVVPGRGVGRALGVPTANLQIDPRVAKPIDGVYAAWADLGSQRYVAAVSIGAPPTWPDAPEAVEAHLVGLDADIGGEIVTLSLVHRIRAQRSFGNEEDLAFAIRQDIAQVLGLLQT